MSSGPGESHCCINTPVGFWLVFMPYPMFRNVSPNAAMFLPPAEIASGMPVFS